MGYLLERNVQVLFVSASSVKDNGKKRMIVIESRPEYAVVTLSGSRKQFPLSWEMIYEAAKRHHQKNLLLEAEAEKPRNSPRRRRAD